MKKIDLVNGLDNFLEFLRLKDNRERDEPYRTVFVNHKRPQDYFKKLQTLKYSNNIIKTTKYNILNFIPKNLFEQFRRIANIFFLINIILMFLLPEPPSSPYTSVIPLLFVVIVTAIKQAYEDVLRFKSDNQVNNKPVKIFRNGKFSEFKWKDIICGDIIQVLCDEQIPCDLLLLNSKSDDRKCYITTANLDGETNYKLRSVPKYIPDFETENDLGEFECVIEYEKPNKDLYEFSGKLVMKNNEYPISNDNILLRGSCLKIVSHAYGCAIFTGKDTKVMLNTKFQSNKFSCTEKKMNNFIIFFIIVLLVLAMISFFFSIKTKELYDNWYLKDREPAYFDDEVKYNLIVIIFYIQLLNYIIPISMYVTIELQRFVGSQFFEWDLNLYDPITDQPAKANTSDLNEDLGQIEYLFSDKTGTLTENEMLFKQFAINGTIYEERDGYLFRLDSNVPTKIFKDENVSNLFDVLTLCHTVQKEDDNNNKDKDTTKEDNKYQAASPDELCFIKFCLKLGIIYNGDHKDSLNKNKQIRWIKYNNKIDKKFEILDILEFDSTRKRMSIILRDINTNKIKLYCKGAENNVLKQCIGYSNNEQEIDIEIKQCLRDINNFAENGWRTLVLSMKELTLDEYNEIKQELNEAYNDILDRKNRISKVFDKIESNLRLIGSTAIEDKLQDDVADTLDTIRKAGIKVWVLTGDKKETAINISYSCKHFTHDMYKFVLTDVSQPDLIQKELDKFREIIKENSKIEDMQFAFIIDGATLAILLKSEKASNNFRHICMKCSAVLCCRMSPAQKAEVVRLVKTSKNKPMTAAIGDGANDVSMIQEAHVGLGIFGKEGRNAARCADFAFAKFKFLKRILLVHGYLYYTRSSNMILYFFYKNFPFAICQFYYAFLNAFSVASLYDVLILSTYNIFLTSAPILFFGLFEQKMSIDKIEKNPYLYRTIKNNKNLSTLNFIKWNLIAFWHSLVVFIFAFGLFSSGSSLLNDGKLVGSWEFGALVIITIDVVVHVKLLLEWQYLNVFFIVGNSLSLLGFIVFCIVPNSFIIPQFLKEFTEDQSLYWIYYTLLSSPAILFGILGCVIFAIIPDILLKVFENIKRERLIQKLKYIQQKKEKTTKI